MGIETTFVPVDDLAAMRAAIRPNTRLLFAETIANPSGTLADLESLAAIAHDAGVAFAVDNTFASPYLCRPIERGADLVVHSATKFISGHGTTIGGVLVESGTFPWSNGRFPLLSEPSPGYHRKVFTETFGEYAFLMRARAEVLRDVGAQMSPMDAWLLLLGLETLAIRMERHVRNARAIAEYLKGTAGSRLGARAAARLDFHLRVAGRPRSRPALHRRAGTVESLGQRRRRKESRHPSGFYHALAAFR